MPSGFTARRVRPLRYRASRWRVDQPGVMQHPPASTGRRELNPSVVMAAKTPRNRRPRCSYPIRATGAHERSVSHDTLELGETDENIGRPRPSPYLRLLFWDHTSLSFRAFAFCSPLTRMAIRRARISCTRIGFGATCSMWRFCIPIHPCTFRILFVFVSLLIRFGPDLRLASCPGTFRILFVFVSLLIRFAFCSLYSFTYSRFRFLFSVCQGVDMRYLSSRLSISLA